MRQIKFFSVLAIVIFAIESSSAVVSTAQAQFYVSGNAGFALLSDSEISDSSGAENLIEYDTGFGVTGAAGYAWGLFRLEGEISYQENSFDRLRVNSLTLGGTTFTSAFGIADMGGDVSALGFMANAWRDFDNMGPGWENWVTFVGAGIGSAIVNIDITSIGGAATAFDESDTVFAYQLGAGFGYKVSPSTTVVLQYRMFGTTDMEFNDGVDKLEADYFSNNILVGVITKF